MNCKQPLGALTVGQAPPYPMLWQKPVAGVPTRTRENRQRVLVAYTLRIAETDGYGLRPNLPYALLNPSPPRGEGNRSVGMRAAVGVRGCLQFVLYTVANAACLLPPPRPSPTGEGVVWWATAERSPQRGGVELQTAPRRFNGGASPTLPDAVAETRRRRTDTHAGKPTARACGTHATDCRNGRLRTSS